MGMCTGAGYVLGFTLLHEFVADDVRGQVFAALYTIVRFCLLLALTAAPVIAGVLDRVSRRVFEHDLAFGGFTVALPGVRLALWFGGVVILVGAGLAGRALQGVRHAEADAPA